MARFFGALSRMALSTSASKPLLRGVVCDCDGTIIESVLDFAEMYRKVGVSRDKDILSVISAWPEKEREAAHKIIRDMETEALQKMQLVPGAASLGSYCSSRGIPMGLVTRNTSGCVVHLHAHHWKLPLKPFYPALARDSGFQHKPAPDALLECAKRWGVEAAGCVMIGDSARDDVVAGRRAGMRTILLNSQHTRSSGKQAPLAGEQVPDAVVSSLEEVPGVIESLFVVQ